MKFTSVSRQVFSGPMSRVWTLSYPEFPQTEAEISSFYNMTLAGSFEEYWISSDQQGAFSLIAPNGEMPPKRLSAEVQIADDSWYPQTVEFVEARAQEVGAPSLSIWTRSDKSARKATLESLGYQVIQTAPSSRLDLQSFDADRFNAKVAACPFEVVPIRSFEERGIDWVPLLYKTTLEIARDVPDPHDFEPMPFEEYREMLKNPVVYDTRLMFAAMDGDQIIGYTRVTPYKGDPTQVATGLSGVLRAYRRQGVVTKLKLTAIQALKQLGYKTVRTENDITNPMYQLNLDLGFEWEWDWMQYDRALTSKSD